MPHAEGAALAGGADGFDLGAVGGADRLDDGEPETGSARLARARAVGAEEALEYMRYRFLRDPQAVVRDLEHRPGTLAPHAERDVPATRGVLDGVVEQVDDHLLETRPIAFHRDGGAGIALDANRSIGGEETHLLGGRGGELGEVEALPGAPHLTGIEARQGEEALDDLGEPLDLLENTAERLARLARQLPSCARPSSSPRITVSGVRSSWLALATNCLEPRSASSRRLIMRLRDTESRSSSSPLSTTGSRSLSECCVISSALSAMRSTGSSARCTRRNPPATATATAMGSPTASMISTCVRVFSTEPPEAPTSTR